MEPQQCNGRSGVTLHVSAAQLSLEVLRCLAALMSALREDAAARGTVPAQHLVHTQQDPEFEGELELYVGGVYVMTGQADVVLGERRRMIDALAEARA